jgi:hypothetical protein
MDALSEPITFVIPQRITPEQIAEVKALDATFIAQAATSADSIADAGLTAWDLGTKLKEMKDICPIGTFILLLQTMGIDPQRAESAMRVARRHRRTELEARKANSTRQLMLLMNLIPEKEEIEQTGNVSVSTNKTHHRWVNEFAGWKQRVDKGLARVNLEEVKKDTQEILSYLLILHGINRDGKAVRGPGGQFIRRAA